MRVLIAGSHGLIGSSLVEHLRARGDQVVRLVRRPVRGPGEVFWAPDDGILDPRSVDGVDAVVNLAGAGIGDHRWTADYKRVLVESRLRTTGLLARVLASAEHPPPVWVQASAVGYYGDRGAELLTESSARGSGFLSELCVRWERATRPAEQNGVRVVHARTGIVMSGRGGAFGRLLPLLRAGLGGRLGSGNQYWSWITLPDEVAALAHVITVRGDSAPSGPVNIVGPEAATNAQIVATLARELKRPAFCHVPATALRIALGEFSTDILSSQRVVPQALNDSGFRHHHDNLGAAVRWLIADR